MQWFEDEVKRLELQREGLQYQPKVVFYGSSSITLWPDLNNDFLDFLPCNLGFGGSTIAACTWYFERIFSGYKPESIILYAGDNDLGDGRLAEEVLIFYQMLMVKIRSLFGNIPCGFISIKPSIARWNIIDRIKYTNTLIQEEIRMRNENSIFIDIFPKMLDEKGFPNSIYYQEDGLHLSKEGYKLWQEVILSYSSRFI